MVNIISSLFGANPHKKTAEQLYIHIVEQARLPVFYEDYAVPDTVQGRLDMLGIHIFIILEYFARAQAALKNNEADDSIKDSKALSQYLVDFLVDDMEVNLRQLGISDMRVGKKVQETMRNIYGRLEAYQVAFRGDNAKTTDVAMLDVLDRNLYKDVYDDITEERKLICRYIKSAIIDLEAQSFCDVLKNNFVFLTPVSK
jgi:cytochrome b pre-mRNA-processing protein 3